MILSERSLRRGPVINVTAVTILSKEFLTSITSETATLLLSTFGRKFMESNFLKKNKIIVLPNSMKSQFLKCLILYQFLIGTFGGKLSISCMTTSGGRLMPS